MKKILFFENDEASANFYGLGLEKFQFHVTLYDHPPKNKEALINLVLTENPDIILTRIELPQMDGYKLTEILKSNNRTKNIPIFALVSNNEKENSEKNIGLGIKSYFIINKTSIEEMVNRLNLEKTAFKIKLKGFLEYLKRIPTGRIGRKNYFFGLLFFPILASFIFFIILFVISVSTDHVNFLFILFLLFFSILYILYIFSLHIRRLHDIGKTGWLILFGPITVLLILFIKGNSSINKYGDIPSRNFLKDVFNINK